MTLDQVQEIAGRLPDSVFSQMQCGAASGRPWTCRLWVFNEGSRSLHIFFSQRTGTWLVSAWRSL
jgi:hypothetical protein